MNRIARICNRVTLAMVAVVAAWAVLATSAGATRIPLTPRRMFASSDAVAPLVTVHALDTFTSANGTNLHNRLDSIGVQWTVHEGAMTIQGNAATAASFGVATVPTTKKDVMVKADLSFGIDARYSGIVMHRGPAGELRVIVDGDRNNQRVTLVRVVGTVSTVLQSSPMAPAPSRDAALRVESIAGQLRVWLNGALVLQRTLTGIDATIATQTRYGLIIDPATTNALWDWLRLLFGLYDRADGFMVIAKR